MRFITFITILLIITPIASAQLELDAETAETFLNTILGTGGQGQPTLDDIDVSIGDLMTSLACGCMDDDSCDSILATFCSGFIDIPGADQTFLRPLIQIASDPSHAMCAAGFSLDPNAVPPDIDPYEPVTSAIPEEPSLMIEAARIIDDDRFTYAIRYHLSIDDEEFDDYDGIDYTIENGPRTKDVSELIALTREGEEVFPATATITDVTLYTHACISFDEVPAGLPGSFCVPMVEVDS